MDLETALYTAARSGDLAVVQELLTLHPGVDLNRPSPTFTPLHNACWIGRADMAAFLLQQPGIDVNSLTANGFTPFFYACTGGKLEIVKLLLKDQRVDVNLAGNDGKTPLWRTCYAGHERIVRWMIASGREFDWNRPAFTWDGLECSPSEVARARGLVSLTNLLDAFLSRPAQVRFETRIELKIPEELAASLFMMVVLHSDGHLRLKKKGSSSRAPVKRFFAILERLPMELQMLVCHRVYSSVREYVPRETSEMALRALVPKLKKPFSGMLRKEVTEAAKSPLVHTMLFVIALLVLVLAAFLLGLHGAPL